MTKQICFSTTIRLRSSFIPQPLLSLRPGAKASCPPGSWFCAAPPDEQAAPAGQPVHPLKPLPPPDGDEATANSGLRPPRPSQGAPLGASARGLSSRPPDHLRCTSTIDLLRATCSHASASGVRPRGSRGP